MSEVGVLQSTLLLLVSAEWFPLKKLDSQLSGLESKINWSWKSKKGFDFFFLNVMKYLFMALNLMLFVRKASISEVVNENGKSLFPDIFNCFGGKKLKTFKWLRELKRCQKNSPFFPFSVHFSAVNFYFSGQCFWEKERGKSKANWDDWSWILDLGWCQQSSP